MRSTPATSLSRATLLIMLVVPLLVAPRNAETAEERQDTARRVTQREYIHTLQDLLKIPEDAAREVSRSLPPEASSGDFDTVAANQGISGLHVRSYLQAANDALDIAIKLGPAPDSGPRRIDYANSYASFIADGLFFGGGVVKILDDAAVLIADYTCTYTLDTSFGIPIEQAGLYRATLEAYRWQGDDTPVVFNLFRGSKQGVVGSLDEIIGIWDLVDDEPKTVSLTTYLRPGDLLGPCVAELDTNGGNPFLYVNENITLNDSDDYPGEGVAFKYIELEGPLYGSWPPASTQAVLFGVDFTANGEIQLEGSPEEHLVEIVADFAERAFRRPVEGYEVNALVALGHDVLDEGRPFLEAVRVPLTAILASPEFLYQQQEYDPGQIDEYEYATRLAYFLWRSQPDQELKDLAAQGALSDPTTVAEQIDRMLEDEKSWRFVEDFADQAYQLDQIKATTPSLSFPYDSQLGVAMEAETKLFLATLINENLSVSNLIDSDFIFINRRLARLYEIPGILGQEMRRFDLPDDSVRGGLLTQGSILKITANGTTTSPVPRGNFVLGPLLGTPTLPPPASVTGLEPDTRGTTTIRQQLDAHRTEPVCNSCHQVIDPPGFALEQFNPIGGLRTKYLGSNLPVDASGVTPGGRSFDGIVDYKQILLDEQLSQVARNLVSQLMVFGTGKKLGPDDRDEVERILADLEQGDYGFRSAIAAVAQSPLFGRR